MRAVVPALASDLLVFNVSYVPLAVDRDLRDELRFLLLAVFETARP